MKNAPRKPRSALDSKDTSSHTQQLQIIALLKQHQSMNTPEFRERGIMAPAPRILELKAKGHQIEKILETYTDPTGKIHHGVARYYLTNNPPANDSESEVAA